LAEALAAGDTPSPEMVAASEDAGALSVRTAVACLATVVFGLIAMMLFDRTNVVSLSPFPYAPEVLAQKASEMAARLGYTDPPRDRTYQFSNTADYLYTTWAEKNLKPDEYRAALAHGRPAPMLFNFAQAPQYLEVRGELDYLRFDGGLAAPGLTILQLDPQGRLVSLRAVPPRAESGQGPVSSQNGAVHMDWNKLFEAAGLDQAQWILSDPREIPENPFDERAAWTGTYAGVPQIPLRIEAAAWRGRPVLFDTRGPWSREAGTPAGVGPPGALATAIIVVFFGGVLLGLRNLRSGRGDLRGSLRLASVTLVGGFVGGLLLVHNTPSAGQVQTLFLLLAGNLLESAFVWAVYMALEPYVRRHWPHALISWTKLLNGGARDPVVAGHFLLGTAAAVALMVLGTLLPDRALPPVVPADSYFEPVSLAGDWFSSLNSAPAFALGIFFLLFLARLLVRRTWLAFIVVLLVLAAINNLQGEGAVLIVRGLIVGSIFVAVGLRFGVLPLVAAEFFSAPSLFFSADLSSWLGKVVLMQVGLTIVAAVWSFRYALGGRKVLKGDILEG
jgi:serine/threonine-protein kinase